jgi:hypothetical protein
LRVGHPLVGRDVVSWLFRDRRRVRS